MNPEDAKKVFQGTIFSVWQWEQELYDGSTKTFEKIGRTSTANTVGILPDNRIMLVWDEQPGREVEGVLTAPGGQIDEGETPEQTAAREFFEETGYIAGSLTPWFSYTPWAKAMFSVHFFIAKNIEEKGKPQNGAGERTQPRFFTFDEFIALGQNEQLRDSRLRIMLLEAQLDPTKKQAIYNLFYA